MPQPLPAGTLRSLDDGLTIADLRRPRGGRWSGVLFDNPALWLAPTFAWTFIVEYGEVARADGRTPVGLCLEGVPLNSRSWQEMTGQRAVSPSFASPIESSVYFFAHHRYDQTKLLVVEQRDHSLHVVAEVRGDVDGLGIESVPVDAWLLFDGITVALSDPPSSVDAARTLLEGFTDTAGLEGFERDDTFWFTPAR